MFGLLAPIVQGLIWSPAEYELLYRFVIAVSTLSLVVVVTIRCRVVSCQQHHESVSATAQQNHERKMGKIKGIY